MIVGKVLIVGAIIYFYNRNIYPNNFTLFMLTTIMVNGIFILGLACYGNIQGILEPVIVQQASEMSTSQKTNSYSIFVLLFYIIPSAVSLLSFWIYENTINKVIIDKEYFEKRSWWKL